MLEVSTEANVVAENADIESAAPVKDEAVNVEPTQNTEEKTKIDDKNQSEEFVPFPKKARNAISYRDKQIAKLRAELREYQEKAQQQPQPQNTGPKEDDFDSYSDFLEAKILHKIKSEQSPQPKEAQPQDSQREQYIAQKQAEIGVKSQEYARTIPDYQEVLSENVELLDYLPSEIQDVFYEADDAALAFYNLAKSGDLALLAEMSPYKAAMVIAKAQIAPQKQTPAPKHIPMSGAKGTGSAGSSLDSIKNDPDKLMKWLNT